jgi:hypothetical protein
VRRVADVGLRRAAVDPALAGAGGLDVVAAHPAAQRDLAVEQHVEAGRLVTLGVDRGAGGERLDDAVPGQEVELPVVELLEQEQRLELVRREPPEFRLRHYCASR